MPTLTFINRPMIATGIRLVFARDLLDFEKLLSGIATGTYLDGQNGYYFCAGWDSRSGHGSRGLCAVRVRGGVVGREGAVAALRGRCAEG